MQTCISLGLAPGASGAVSRNRLSEPALLPTTMANSPPPKSATCNQLALRMWACLGMCMSNTCNGRAPPTYLHGADGAISDPGRQLLHCCALVDAAAAQPHLQVGHCQAVLLHGTELASHNLIIAICSISIDVGDGCKS